MLTNTSTLLHSCDMLFTVFSYIKEKPFDTFDVRRLKQESLADAATYLPYIENADESPGP